ncbi:hypothetical protein K438DRAFT_982817 [Mycena galopus ATCC 62051]|nr:hypothetical protein K438DRAFT_982817 [Mycena galopus ATCC 62051]
MRWWGAVAVHRFTHVTELHALHPCRYVGAGRSMHASPRVHVPAGGPAQEYPCASILTCASPQGRYCAHFPALVTPHGPHTLIPARPHPDLPAVPSSLPVPQRPYILPARTSGDASPRTDLATGIRQHVDPRTRVPTRTYVHAPPHAHLPPQSCPRASPCMYRPIRISPRETLRRDIPAGPSSHAHPRRDAAARSGATRSAANVCPHQMPCT